MTHKSPRKITEYNPCYWPNCKNQKIGIYSPGCPRVNWCKFHLKEGTRIDNAMTNPLILEKTNFIYNEIKNFGKSNIPPEVTEEREPTENDYL